MPEVQEGEADMRTLKFCAALAASLALVCGGFVLGVLLMGELAQLVHWIIKG